ncbi:MBL fold metallo-hydrolase [Herbaspirillum sp. WKF16]|jgi:L-ascorbate metabolism protein UlaG (beta-lactamase superfamily)|uniref:MBL fold metallo-hydrolase n=1 Tax=Herbaspirillum sp. WKF16 TaxID=3028312 RepID=UPI0023A915AE|nr:MBL fold metallo-hydrolase [Herbaspirillum sp. WKF16]WDZ97741.1 MBL fold metallo-hydrolase [Herbaspirillum sp. WKF16]
MPTDLPTQHHRPRVLAQALGLLLVLALALAGCSSSGKYYDPAKSNRTENGFRNNYPQTERASFWKWQWERLTQGLPKPPANDYRFPVQKPDLAWLKANRIAPSVTWIGHATAFIQIGGKNVLTDPMFSQRASPFSFIGPERKVPLPVQVSELPHVDVVVISHNHYDHLDRASVEQLNLQPGGPPLFLVPLGLLAWFNDIGITNVREMDWWDRLSLGSLDIYFVPAAHWSARGLFDRSETLWGGWVLRNLKMPATTETPESEQSDAYSIYFAGDTGYSKDFRDIGERFGRFDLALIPIGAYAPRWFMQNQHVDPAQAVQIHEDVRAKRSIGIHWGTFELADEPLDEPPQKLAEALKEARLPPDQFITLRHGETLKLDE